jgi:hypothetical protein
MRPLPDVAGVEVAAAVGEDVKLATARGIAGRPNYLFGDQLHGLN